MTVGRLIFIVKLLQITSSAALINLSQKYHLSKNLLIFRGLQLLLGEHFSKKTNPIKSTEMLQINLSYSGPTTETMYRSPLGCRMFMTSSSMPPKYTNLSPGGQKTNIFKISKISCQILKSQPKRNLTS